MRFPPAQRGSDPDTAVAARNGVGFSSLQPYRIHVERGQGLHRFEIDMSGHSGFVGPRDELVWVVFPEGTGEFATFWDATAVGVDIEFEDGTWLSESEAEDQYGGPISPVQQAAAKRLWVDQWNRRAVSLGPMTGRRIRRVVAAVEASERCSVRVFIDDVRVGPATQPPRDPLDLVSTTRGTHSSDRFSRGNAAPLVAVPHGGVFGLPMTDASQANWPYSYHEHNRLADNRPMLQAFATSHLPSPWMGDRGVFQVMPSPLADPDPSRPGRALAFSHPAEQDGPHRYRVELEGGVTAELTAAEFALGMCFTYPAETGSVIFDHHGTVREFSLGREGGDTVVQALLDDRPGTPPHHIQVRLRGVIGNHLRHENQHLSGYLTVETGDSRTVDLLLGISTIDAAQAAKNLSAAGSFAAMRSAAKQLWRDRLSTLAVTGATPDQQVSLYSGLYRVFLYPNRYAETAGRDRPEYRSPYDPALTAPVDHDGKLTMGTGEFSTTHGFWDTYRTVWPLLALLEPGTTGALAQGFIQHFHDGGWTPRWSAPGAQDCMTGTTFDTVLADLLLRGVPGVERQAGYDSVLKNATVPAENPRVGRKGLHPGIFRGYIDTATPEGLSWTLDNAINDAAAAQLARLLSQDLGIERDHENLAAEWEYFARRALGYRQVFDASRKFFIGRTPQGQWRVGSEFDPEEWGHDYTETNAWGTAFTVPHDGRGLADLYGGEEALGEALDVFFARPETGHASKSGSYGFAIHEMAEARDVRMGMLGLSNQPAHHIPFMYMFAGRHDDAHRSIHEARSRLFVGSDIGQGYPGDEDNGEMSGWYIFTTIGLYPLVPASATYVVVPPAVRRTELRPVGGPPIVIEVVDGTPGAGYVRSLRVNGAPWHSISIPHAVLAAGAHLQFELSSTAPAGRGRPVRCRCRNCTDLPTRWSMPPQLVGRFVPPSPVLRLYSMTSAPPPSP